MKIILVGYMGCGKSFIGKGLAKTYKIPFIDMDKYIEKNVGKTIANIFATQGEEEFRKIEKDALEKILKQSDDMVLSTGGGTPCFFENMQLMNKQGITLFLDASIGLIERRLIKGKANRPIVAQQKDLRGFISSHLQRRLPYYQQAQIHLQFADNISYQLANMAIDNYLQETKTNLQDI